MPTVQAVFENGVFRPTAQVQIPDHSVVEFEPRIVAASPAQSTLDDVYAILDRRFDSGLTDVAARHNEHQP